MTDARTVAPAEALSQEKRPVTAHEDESALETLAGLFKAGGDRLRLDILRVLRRDTFGVMELSQIFAMRQSGMSHHLKVLARAGLLEPQREGNAIFYRRPLLRGQDSPQHQAARALFTAVDSLPLPSWLLARVAEIREQRSAQSQAFFARHAERFREQQELIAEHPQYAEPVAELIRRQFQGHPAGRALEIGPGEGDFLATLAERFHQVTAVDNAREMLDQARARCQRQGLENVRLVLGECDQLLKDPDTAGAYDLVVANMVLHHMAGPADVFQHSARLLASGGRLILSELCRHEQRWVRDNCGDLWQGFEPEELTGWALDAGLTSGETVFIGLRNGFQIQVREFIHRSY
ncbi:MAG: metalloregulator ArsR/SmtB family transcription factor [Oleiphilaceae bacterium]|nr:metalloregulator ArsR/SmtB family transcription factor [Oleiphilaceae bacterium]